MNVSSGVHFGAAKKPTGGKKPAKTSPKAAKPVAKPTKEKPAARNEAENYYTHIHSIGQGRGIVQYEALKENAQTYKAMLNKAGIALPMISIKMDDDELVIQVPTKEDIPKAVAEFTKAGHKVYEHNLFHYPIVQSLPGAQYRHTVVFGTPAKAYAC